MKNLTADELFERMDFKAPLSSPEKPDVWCIPFEYGSQRKGTKIKISTARFISAELRAHVAEEWNRQLKEHFDAEVERGKETARQYAKIQDENARLRGEIEILKRRRKSR